MPCIKWSQLKNTEWFVREVFQLCWHQLNRISYCKAIHKSNLVLVGGKQTWQIFVLHGYMPFYIMCCHGSYSTAPMGTTVTTVQVVAFCHHHHHILPRGPEWHVCWGHCTWWSKLVLYHHNWLTFLLYWVPVGSTNLLGVYREMQNIFFKTASSLFYHNWLQLLLPPSLLKAMLFQFPMFFNLPGNYHF